jgi:hypothetical protein
VVDAGGGRRNTIVPVRAESEFLSEAVLKLRALYLAVAILVFVPLLVAQQKAAAPLLMPAPVPVQITNAQKVFISNAGGESFETVMEQTVFNGGADRPYNEFYAAIKDWGRFELVSNPNAADLVLEISWVLADTGLKLPVLGEIRLVVVDPHTHVTLWSVIQHVRGALLMGNRDKNFDQAMAAIVSRMKVLAASSTPAATGK